jgi:hypothetical protein
VATVVSNLTEIWDSKLEKFGELFITSWTSDAGGAYTETVTMKGWLVLVVTDPGSTAPTDNYDLTLISALGGHDVLGGALNDRDTTTTEPYPHPVTNPGVSVICYVNGSYTITIAAAGNANQGTIYWYVKNR